MTLSDVALHRLRQQYILQPQLTNPQDVVTSLGAVQAQDYFGALWAIGLRLQSVMDSDVEQALSTRKIVRTWPMRGTLHFVPAADVRWMLKLLTPRILATNARRLKKDFDLDEKVFTKSKKIFAQVLQGGKQLSRASMYNALEAAHISAEGQRGLHILWRLAQDGFICFGAREGKQQTFVLLEEWLVAPKEISYEESLARLTRSYFTGHGPATLQDFTWWSGLAPAEAKTGLDMVMSVLRRERIGDQIFWMSTDTPILKKNSSSAYLLPSYDEFMIGYKDRSASLDIPDSEEPINHGSGIFNPVVIVRGKVVGTWKRKLTNEKVNIEVRPFYSFNTAERTAIAFAAKQYGKFLGKDVRCELG